MINSRDLSIFKTLPKQAMPILNSVKFEKNKASMTDLEMAITVKLQNDTRALIPFEVLKKLRSFEILDDHTISDGSRVIGIKDPLSVKDFPIIKHVPRGKLEKLPVDVLRTCLKHVSEDESRPALNHVLVSSKGLTGTDGHSLYWHRKSIPGIPELLLPPRPLKAILKCSGDSIGIRYDDNLITLSATNHVVTFKRPDLTFPDFEKVVPKKYEQIDVNTRELISKCTSMLPFSNELTHCVKMTMEKQTMSLHSSNDNTEASDSIPCSSRVTGEIGFNIELLRRLPDDSKIGFCHDGSQVECQRPLVAESSDDIILVMPLRLAA